MRNISHGLFTRTALSAAVAIVAAAPAWAQNTTSAVNGTVVGADGKPVAGALVTIVHRESGSANNITTDAEGRYAARGLRVGGPYTITVSKGGAREIRDDVYLQLAETLSLDLKLSSVTLQTVTITGSASRVFNRSSMGAGTQLGRKELDSYASLNRNLQDYARLDPRLAQTDKERGEISAAGQNTRYNSVTIDGVAINDTFGLESNNLPTAKQPISVDAIQSVQVNLSNYDVTQKGYTGANINAVTKSGTNQFKGSAYYVFRNDKFAGDKFNRASGTYFKSLPYKEDTKGFTLGGPIIEDKLFFFGSYEVLRSNRAQPEFGPIGSSLTNVAISQSVIDRLQQVANTKYGINVGSAIGPTELSVKDSLLKLDWNISEQHRANVRFSRTNQAETNGGGFGGYSPTGLQLTSAWYSQEKKIDTLVGQVFSDWTSNFSTEFKLSNRNYHSEPINNAKLPAMALRFFGAAPDGAPAGVNTGTRFLNFGTEQSRHFNVLDTKTLDAYLGGTLSMDAHELKFGGDVSRNKVYNAFFQNTYGNYTFACQDGVAYSFAPNAATNKCSAFTPGQIETAVLENFQAGRAGSYQVQVPAANRTLDDGIAKWNLNNLGLFLQDTWTVNKQLTITAGVRYDRLNTPDKPLVNEAAKAARVAGSVSGTTVVRETGGFGLDNTLTLNGSSLIQPRVGFNWTLDGADLGRTQIRGGVGLFQGAAANVWLSNPFSNTGVTTRIVGCGITGFSACSNDPLLNVDVTKQPTNFTGATPAANVDFISSGLKQPSVWKANLAVDTEVAGLGVFAAEFLYTKTKTGIYYEHLNLGAATRTGADGRQMFYTPQAYNPACWSSSGLSTSGACSGSRARALSNSAFNNVLLAKETSEGGGNAVTLSLANPSRSRLGWQVAYTYTDAKEVSPLTSSVSNSNYNARAVFNSNEVVAANSAYLIRDRVTASVNWSEAFVGKYRTTMGLFFEGRRGKPYSWTYGNDMNGDGISGNDLMYVPRGPQSGEVVFKGDTATSRTNEDRFWSFVNGNPDLNALRGSVAGRNTSFAPWVNTIDLRLSQELPGFTNQHKGRISFDIMNFGNLVNKKWGQINEIPFSSAGGQRRNMVNFAGIDAQGRYIYDVSSSLNDYTVRQVKGESQWAAQVTLRYDF